MVYFCLVVHVNNLVDKQSFIWSGKTHSVVGKVGFINPKLFLMLLTEVSLSYKLAFHVLC